jgi:hypothetical protein
MLDGRCDIRKPRWTVAVDAAGVIRRIHEQFGAAVEAETEASIGAVEHILTGMRGSIDAVLHLETSCWHNDARIGDAGAVGHDVLVSIGAGVGTGAPGGAAQRRREQ